LTQHSIAFVHYLALFLQFIVSTLFYHIIVLIQEFVLYFYLQLFVEV